MSGKETSFFSKKRSRRKTTETLRSIIEIEHEDYKRFPYYLRKLAEEENFSFFTKINTYKVKEDGQIIPMELSIVVGEDYAPEQLSRPIINAYCDMDFALKKVICISPHMDTRILLALNKTFLHFSKLFTLGLDYCDLTSDNINLLAAGLKCKQTIKELSLKGNPNKTQNFYLLIGCELKIFNLKFCGIDENGLKKIAAEICQSAPDSTLIHLDLSSNMVFDEGCAAVSKILRCDRTLQSLNLSDCKIGDEGFEDIIKSFQKFSLYEEEIYMRRKLRLEYFKLLQKEKDGSSDNIKHVCLGEDQDHAQDVLAMAEDKLKKHPFTSECVQENEDIFCKGNYKLESLNISYNHLTKKSFDLILRTLMSQSSTFGFDAGLKRLILDGNSDGDDSRNAVEEFLYSKKTRKSLSGSAASARGKGNLKRRKASATSSVTIESTK